MNLINLFRGNNTATLSGAIDIIAVEDEDGLIRCTPFHVRFGRLSGVLNPKEKVVSINVNGKRVGMKMKLGDAGEAFFVEETNVYSGAFDATSPISSPLSSPMRQAHSEDNSQTTMEPLSLDDSAQETVVNSKERKLSVNIDEAKWLEEYPLLSPQSSASSEPASERPAKDKKVERRQSSSPPTFSSDDEREVGAAGDSAPANFIEVDEGGKQTKPADHQMEQAAPAELISDDGDSKKPDSWSWKWEWGAVKPVREKSSFDKKRSRQKSGRKKNKDRAAESMAPNGDQIGLPDKDQLSSMEDGVVSSFLPISRATSKVRIKNVELSLCAHLLDLKESLMSDDGGYALSVDSMAVFSQHALDADKFFSNPDKSALLNDDRLIFLIDRSYFYTWEKAAPLIVAAIAYGDKDSPAESGMSTKLTPESETSAAKSSFFGAWFGGSKETKQPAADSSPESEDKAALSSPGLKIDIAPAEPPAIGRGHTESPFAPVAGAVETGQSMAKATVTRDEVGRRSANLDDIARPPSIASRGSSRNATPLTSPDQRPVDVSPAGSDLSQDARKVRNRGDSMFYRRRTRPSPNEVGNWNLVDGQNEIEFSVNTSTNATVVVRARIFLWPINSKIVVSDVDGTITKSDVLGHIMPTFGATWSHTGVVSLYSKIVENGYRLMYLSSRAIGQADRTKTYLDGLNEGDAKLPAGPVILSPDRLFQSLAREVYYHRPQDFKVPALKDIRNLFPASAPSPFYAGFGNRDSDIIAYKAVDIVDGRIFVINPRGEIVANNHKKEFNYVSLEKLKDKVFPYIIPRSRETSSSITVHDSFSDANFWKIPIRDPDSGNEEDHVLSDNSDFEGVEAETA
eukprot:Stramenopile-MAST_4_protein_1648